MKINRHNFLRQTAAVAAGGLLSNAFTGGACGEQGERLGQSGTIVPLFPHDGDVLNRHDGEEANGQLHITVRGEAPAHVPVNVNGIEALRDGRTFTCRVSLAKQRNIITIKAGKTKQELLLWWDQDSRKRFRFSCDDNIEFLRDLATKPEDYPSLFDHPFLGFWREMHDTYGAKIHLNIYYQTNGFTLENMPDTWKKEWQRNAPWLHLSFHARQDKPDRPYHDADYGQLAGDYDLVCNEIRRFSGEEVISTTTTLHWADCPTKTLSALRDRDIRRVIGLFETKNGVCTTGYQLPPDITAHCDTRGAWYHRQTDMMFVRCTAVVNALEVARIAPYLDTRTNTPQTSEMVELLIHEQYFRKELHYYQPTIHEKVRTALEWVTEHGYEPVFWSDGFLGTPSAQPI